ncbi:FAD NAD(P)-binding protein [Fusarium pseudoanthophilum]|uniref:FAD NAD(P)-binding protein n=1 Tax=Fusarium pseudoanthophilum TaxID=48495 RepID=A0A8H5NT65_9HYPO|nr:FAD NAD(P)-binding protein [Fusarium pseudoanthophilum]
MSIPGFPVKGSPQSYWQHEAQKQQVPAPSEPLPSSCDVAIVGGGYAGIATAYHILKTASPPPSVFLLEAKDPCSGATGRNGGHLRPDYLMGAASNSKRYSASAAAEIVQFEARHLDVIRAIIKEEAIDCDFAETESLAVLTTPGQVSMVSEVYEGLRQSPSFSDTLLDVVEFYEGDDAPQRTGLRDAKGYFSTPAARVSPYKLLIALSERCVAMGLSLKTQTTVVSVEHSGSDGHILRMSSGETMTAQKVVIATNAYTPSLLPEYASSIVPCKGLACHITGPKGKTLPDLLATSYAIMEQDPVSNKTGYNYMVQLDDNSIVVGGAHHKYDENDPGSWYNNVDDTQLIEPARRYFEDDYMQQTFVGWEESGARVDRVWTGIMGYSTDSLPHVGEVPGRDGVFVIAGFHGHGMPVIFLAAEGIAAMTQGLIYEKTGMPSLFKTSEDRLKSERNDILAGRGIRSTKE